MATTDKRIDAYIQKSAPFAQPILVHVRKLVHKACPDVEETIKWGFPNFEYKGSILCSMASFKQHCSFTFWKASLMKDPHGLFSAVGKTAMGQMGRITHVKDLPADKIMVSYLKEAMKLNEEGVKISAPAKKTVKKELDIPGYFMQALGKNKKALSTFENFSYSNKKEYVEWVTDAKTDDTRDKRMATAVEWLAEGKVRNWKYIKK